jgi:hypothetical protein
MMQHRNSVADLASLRRMGKLLIDCHPGAQCAQAAGNPFEKSIGIS